MMILTLISWKTSARSLEIISIWFLDSIKKIFHFNNVIKGVISIGDFALIRRGLYMENRLKLLEHVRSTAQFGIEYTHNPYDIERYEMMQSTSN